MEAFNIVSALTRKNREEIIIDVNSFCMYCNFVYVNNSTYVWILRHHQIGGEC